MQRLPCGVYPKEFREHAVRLVLDEGLPILQAGQRLSRSAKPLANWVGAARRGELAALNAFTTVSVSKPGWTICLPPRLNNDSINVNVSKRDLVGVHSCRPTQSKRT